MRKTLLIQIFFLFLLCFLFLIPLISAGDTDVIKASYGKVYDLKRACFNNGTYCSGASQCNVTVNYPNGDTAINNRIMTNQISFHNLTIPASTIKQLGDYPSSMVCNDGLYSGSDTFTLQITGDGGDNNAFPPQFVILILSVIFIVIGKVKSELRLFTILGSMVAITIGIITLYPGYSSINYTTLMGQSIGFVSLGFGFYFLIEGSFSKEKQVETFDLYNDGRYYEND